MSIPFLSSETRVVNIFTLSDFQHFSFGELTGVKSATGCYTRLFPGQRPLGKRARRALSSCNFVISRVMTSHNHPACRAISFEPVLSSAARLTELIRRETRFAHPRQRSPSVVTVTCPARAPTAFASAVYLPCLVSVPGPEHHLDKQKFTPSTTTLDRDKVSLRL